MMKVKDRFAMELRSTLELCIDATDKEVGKEHVSSLKRILWNQKMIMIVLRDLVEEPNEE